VRGPRLRQRRRPRRWVRRCQGPRSAAQHGRRKDPCHPPHAPSPVGLRPHPGTIRASSYGHRHPNPDAGGGWVPGIQTHALGAAERARPAHGGGVRVPPQRPLRQRPRVPPRAGTTKGGLSLVPSGTRLFPRSCSLLLPVTRGGGQPNSFVGHAPLCHRILCLPFHRDVDLDVPRITISPELTRLPTYQSEFLIT